MKRLLCKWNAKNDFIYNEITFDLGIRLKLFEYVTGYFPRFCTLKFWDAYYTRELYN